METIYWCKPEGNVKANSLRGSDDPESAPLKQVADPWPGSGCLSAIRRSKANWCWDGWDWRWCGLFGQNTRADSGRMRGGSAVPWSQPCGRDDCRVRDTLPLAHRRL